MALPKHIRPEYSTTIPSTGQKIKYQPFSVKEEKVLILAAESGDTDEITNAVRNVLENCVTSPTDFKADKLALFDVEYLFLKTRSKSVGEKIEVRITDPNDDDYVVNHEINIDKIGVLKNPDHKDLVELNGDVHVKMRYPDISFFNDGIDINSVVTSINLITRCISQIVVGEEVYNRDEMSESEMVEWIESLTTKEFTKVCEFFKTMPKLSHTIKLKNPNTGKEFQVTLEGLSDFF